VHSIGSSLVAFFVGALALLAAALPDAEARTTQFRHASLLGIRYNELGLGLFSDTGWRIELFDGEHVLLRDTYAEAGVVTQLSPANFHPGLYLEFVPLAVLKTRFAIQKLQYFGVLGSLQPIENEDWSPDTVQANTDAGRFERAGGESFTVQQTLRAKVGPAVFSVLGSWQHFHFDVPGPFYDAVNEVLLGKNDDLWILKSTAGVALMGEPQMPDSLLVLAMHDFIRTEDHDVERQTLAGVLAWKPPVSMWETGNPLLALVVGGFLDDKYREGEAFFAAALAVEFLMPHRYKSK
jgi:hypothetical protein